jgi:AcrR family transcriptional regulator
MERPVQARTPARERILDTAFRLFYLHGPRGVGIDTVIAESGVAKATLYKHFASKDDLIVAYLDRVDEDWTGKLKAAAATGTTARERLVSMFDARAARRRAGGGPRGGGWGAGPPPRPGPRGVSPLLRIPAR